jgi:GGDEF domain-containing protein
VGVVSLYSPDSDAFTADHQQVLELVARPLAAAIQRAREFERDRRSNLTDAETGLPNHRYLTHLLTTHGFSESLLMHSLGVLAVEWDPSQRTPERLRALADAARAAVRVTDLMFRHGEARLVVLIPDCDDETGRAIADRVTTTTQLAIKSEASSVRVGLALAPADGDTLAELMQAAQSRLRRHRAGAATLNVVSHTGEPEDQTGSARAIPA